jgi:hypothetical protein
MSPDGIRAGGFSEYLPRARALTQRAEALGATLAAWSALTLAFSWDPDGAEEAIALAASLREDAMTEEDTWACGIAQGDMQPLAHSGARADLAWGVPLVVALTLSRIARPAEVLLDASFAQRAQLNLLATREETDGGLRVAGAQLDSRNPWKVEASPPVPPVLIPPASPSASAVIASHAPKTSIRYRSPSTFDMEEVDPDALAARLMQLSKEALIGGDAHSLEKWSDGLKATGEKDSFAERMRAIARLSRGRVADALRALQRARREAETAPSYTRCQASLALGVGLAFAGRADEALLEALDALARAREGHDEQATQACLALLAKLFTSVGRADDAAQFAVRSLRA